MRTSVPSTNPPAACSSLLRRALERFMLAACQSPGGARRHHRGCGEAVVYLYSRAEDYWLQIVMPHAVRFRYAWEPRKPRCPSLAPWVLAWTLCLASGSSPRPSIREETPDFLRQAIAEWRHACGPAAWLGMRAVLLGCTPVW
jgi:hypothetical protein